MYSQKIAELAVVFGIPVVCVLWWYRRHRLGEARLGAVRQMVGALPLEEARNLNNILVDQIVDRVGSARDVEFTIKTLSCLRDRVYELSALQQPNSIANIVEVATAVHPARSAKDATEAEAVLARLRYEEMPSICSRAQLARILSRLEVAFKNPRQTSRVVEEINAIIQARG